MIPLVAHVDLHTYCEQQTATSNNITTSFRYVIYHYPYKIAHSKMDY